ncbi:hypothetical protein ACFX2I_022331 [Malus domestica]
MYRLNNNTNNRIDPERVGKLPLPSDHPATPNSWRMRDRLFRSHSNHSASAEDVTPRQFSADGTFGKELIKLLQERKSSKFPPRSSLNCPLNPESYAETTRRNGAPALSVERMEPTTKLFPLSPLLGLGALHIRQYRLRKRNRARNSIGNIGYGVARQSQKQGLFVTRLIHFTG